MDVASEDLAFPMARGLLGRSTIGSHVATSLSSAGVHSSEVEEEEEARLYAKLTSRSQNHTKYFANRRKEQLLLDAGNPLPLFHTVISMETVAVGKGCKGFRAALNLDQH